MTEEMITTQEMPSADEQLRERNYTSEGRYIPYSGGSAGWDDNGGVPKREMGNNYRYHTVMASDEVRVAQFFRMGQRFDRRGNRVRVLKEVPIGLRWDGGSKSGGTRDISLQGMRLQFVEEIPLVAGQQVTVDLLDANGSPSMVLPSKVVWAKMVGNLRPLWNVGLAFLNLTPQQTDELRDLLGL